MLPGGSARAQETVAWLFAAGSQTREHAELQHFSFPAAGGEVECVRGTQHHGSAEAEGDEHQRLPGQPLPRHLHHPGRSPAQPSQDGEEKCSALRVFLSQALQIEPFNIRAQMNFAAREAFGLAFLRCIYKAYLGWHEGIYLSKDVEILHH